MHRSIVEDTDDSDDELIKAKKKSRVASKKVVNLIGNVALAEHVAGRQVPRSMRIMRTSLHLRIRCVSSFHLVVLNGIGVGV